jgi:hypothetical protein
VYTVRTAVMGSDDGDRVNVAWREMEGEWEGQEGREKS